MLRWLNGDNCTSIQELKVIGGDHDWPGSFGNMDINATREIWDFVSQYDITGLINCNTNTSNQEFELMQERKLLFEIDVLGRQISHLNNDFFIRIYNDGTLSKYYQYQ